jgi:hypothetical protein
LKAGLCASKAATEANESKGDWGGSTACELDL